MKLMSVILTILLGFVVPFVATPGTEKEKAVIVSIGEDAYGEGVDTEMLEIGVSEAIDAGVPSEMIESFVREVARAGKSPQDVSSYLIITAEIQEQGIPPRLMLNTILEGIAKDVPEDAMHRMIATVQTRLLFCNKIAEGHANIRGGKSSERELLLSALFHTMNMGFSESQITTLSQAIDEEKLGGGPFFNILKVTMELQNLGLDNDSITVLMERSIRYRVSIQQISQYPLLVREGKARGLSDEQIYSSILSQADKALTSGRSDSKESTAEGASVNKPGGRGGSQGGSAPSGGGPGHGK